MIYNKKYKKENKNNKKIKNNKNYQTLWICSILRSDNYIIIIYFEKALLYVLLFYIMVIIIVEMIFIYTRTIIITISKINCWCYKNYFIYKIIFEIKSSYKMWLYKITYHTKIKVLHIKQKSSMFDFFVMLFKWEFLHKLLMSSIIYYKRKKVLWEGHIKCVISALLLHSFMNIIDPNLQ